MVARIRDRCFDVRLKVHGKRKQGRERRAQRHAAPAPGHLLDKATALVRRRRLAQSGPRLGPSSGCQSKEEEPRGRMTSEGKRSPFSSCLWPLRSPSGDREPDGG